MHVLASVSLCGSLVLERVVWSYTTAFIRMPACHAASSLVPICLIIWTDGEICASSCAMTCCWLFSFRIPRLLHCLGCWIWLGVAWVIDGFLLHSHCFVSALEVFFVLRLVTPSSVTISCASFAFLLFHYHSFSCYTCSEVGAYDQGS